MTRAPAKPATLADALAKLPPPVNQKSAAYKLEQAGLVDQVLEARRAGVSNARLRTALKSMGVDLSQNAIQEFCRSRGVDPTIRDGDA